MTGGKDRRRRHWGFCKTAPPPSSASDQPAPRAPGTLVTGRSRPGTAIRA